MRNAEASWLFCFWNLSLNLGQNRTVSALLNGDDESLRKLKKLHSLCEKQYDYLYATNNLVAVGWRYAINHIGFLAQIGFVSC